MARPQHQLVATGRTLSDIVYDVRLRVIDLVGKPTADALDAQMEGKPAREQARLLRTLLAEVEDSELKRLSGELERL